MEFLVVDSQRARRRHPTSLAVLLLLVVAASLSNVPSAHGGSSGSNDAEYDGEAGYAAMVSAMRAKGLEKAAYHMERSEFNSTLSFLIARTPLTLLAPLNVAFFRVPRATWRYLYHRPAHMHRVFAYHMLAPRHTAEELRQLKPGTLLRTGYEGMEMEKLEAPPSNHQEVCLGKPSVGRRGSVRIVSPNIYSDAQIVVHGVDRILVLDVLLDL